MLTRQYYYFHDNHTGANACGFEYLIFNKTIVCISIVNFDAFVFKNITWFKRPTLREMGV